MRRALDFGHFLRILASPKKRVKKTITFLGFSSNSKVNAYISHIELNFKNLIYPDSLAILENVLNEINFCLNFMKCKLNFKGRKKVKRYGL